MSCARGTRGRGRLPCRSRAPRRRRGARRCVRSLSWTTVQSLARWPPSAARTLAVEDLPCPQMTATGILARVDRDDDAELLSPRAPSSSPARSRARGPCRSRGSRLSRRGPRGRPRPGNRAPVLLHLEVDHPVTDI